MAHFTGSLADAEDVVQETWIRWAVHDAEVVDNPAGWLTTVTSVWPSTVPPYGDFAVPFA